MDSIWINDIHRFIEENSLGVVTRIDVGGIYTEHPYSIDSFDVEYTAKISHIFDALQSENGMSKIVPSIKKVFFNPPVTVVIFEDGSKEIVRTDEHDNYSPDIGVAMALMRKMFGSRCKFKKFVNKFIDTAECPLCKSKSVYNYVTQYFTCKNRKCLHIFVNRGN